MPSDTGCPPRKRDRHLTEVPGGRREGAAVPSGAARGRTRGRKRRVRTEDGDQWRLRAPAQDPRRRPENPLPTAGKGRLSPAGSRSRAPPASGRRTRRGPTPRPGAAARRLRTRRAARFRAHLLTLLLRPPLARPRARLGLPLGPRRSPLRQRVPVLIVRRAAAEQLSSRAHRRPTAAGGPGHDPRGSRAEGRPGRASRR